MSGFMQTLGTLIDLSLAVFGFTFVIVVHELGHFLAARWAGVRVLAFAVGFGSALVSYRRGLGIRRGSSEREYFGMLAEDAAAVREGRTGTRAKGVSPTEYRLNVFPVGGYVKMLGQNDLSPTESAGDSDSFSRKHPWKRLVIMSAGVACNIVLAAVLFVIAFMAGIEVNPAKVGSLVPGSAAATATSVNSGQTQGPLAHPGLSAGDVITRIDGSKPNSFSDLILASALAAPGEPVRLTVTREGVGGALEFEIVPRASRATGLLELGVLPASTGTIVSGTSAKINEQINREMMLAGFPQLKAGMVLKEIEGAAAKSIHDLDAAVSASGGAAVEAIFADPATGERVSIPVIPEARLQRGEIVGSAKQSHAAMEHLLGIAPVCAVRDVGEKAAGAGLQAGDIFALVGEVEWPTYAAVKREAERHRNGMIRVVVARADNGGELREVDLGLVEVDKEGRIGFYPKNNIGTPLLVGAWPASMGTTDRFEAETDRDGFVSGRDLGVPAGATITRVNGVGVRTYTELRAALAGIAAQTPGLAEYGVTLAFLRPTIGDGRAAVEDEAEWTLTAAELGSIADGGWTNPVPADMFAAETTILRGSSPGAALMMGIRETHRVMMSTYVTFARLFQGTVRADQLKGPVGIAHLGTIIASKGAIWLLFFLGLISVNLAVVNFLPFPIFDGGHVVFLIAEWVRGKPAPESVINGASLVGVVAIALVFLFTTFNDIRNLLP